MRCSECSEVIRPVVSIDIDGTLGDYHRHFLKFAGKYMGLKFVTRDGYNGDKPFREWFKQAYEVDDRTWYDIKLAYRQGAQKRSMPVRPWAARLTHEVQLLGAELWLCTTRPYLRLDGVDPDTRFWLQHFNIYYDHLLYDEHKYVELARHVDPERVCAVLDDLPEDLAEAAQIFGADKTLLMMGPHNAFVWEDGPRDQMVHEGTTAFQRIKERVDGWFARYGEGQTVENIG